MYTTSNISPIYRIATSYLYCSNALYFCELEQMGGVILNSQSATARIAPI